MSERSMRLALLIRQFGPANSDAQYAIAQLGEHLASRGHEVIFLTAIAHGHPPAGCRLIAQFPSLYRYRRAGMSDPWAYVAWADGRIDQGRFDASFSVDAQVPATIVEPRFRLLADRLNPAAAETTIAARIQAGIQRHTLGRRLAWERTALTDPRVKRIVAVSRLVADQVRQQVPAAAGRLMVLPDAVSVEHLGDDWRQQLRQAFGTPDDSRVILWSPAGSPASLRRVVLEAFARRRQAGEPVVLWVLGPPRFADHRLIVRLGVREQVRFLGPSQRLDLACQAADVTLHLPEYAAASRLVLTSLAVGVAVVTHARDGAGEQVVHAGSGQVMDGVLDANGLAETLARWAGRAREPVGRDDAAACHLRRVERIEQLLYAAAGGFQ